MRNSLSIIIFFLLLPTEALEAQVLTDENDPGDQQISSINEYVDSVLYNNPDEALDTMEYIFRKIDSSANTQAIYDLFSNWGMSYYVQGKFIQAYKGFNKALEVAKAMNDPLLQSRAMNSLGLSLTGQDKYKEAIQLHRRSMEIAKRIGNQNSLNRNRLNLGIIYFEQGRLDSALQLFEKTNKTSSDIGDSRMEIISTIWKARTYYHLEENGKASRLYLEALNNPGISLWDKGFAYSGLSKVYLDESKLDSALLTSEQAISIARELDAQWDLQVAYEVIAEVYARKGQYAKAYENYKKFKTVSDSLSAIERERELNALLLEEKNLQHELLKEQSEEQSRLLEKTKIIAVIAIVASFFLVGLLFLAFRWYNQKKKLSQQLKKKNERIELKQKEIQGKNSRLSALNEEKDFIIGMIAHDLRAPLANIQALTSLISEEISTADGEEYLKKLAESSDKMEQMIHRVLDIKAIDNQDLNLKLERIEPADIMHEVADEFEAKAKAKNISIRKKFLTETSYIYSDRSYLAQAIDNLVSNAIKFSPTGSVVHLIIKELDGKILLKVQDEGPGISEEDQKDMFKMYKKLSAKPTAGEESTGLGLAIVNKIIQNLNGEIWLESKPNNGSTFVVAFEKANPENE